MALDAVTNTAWGVLLVFTRPSQALWWGYLAVAAAIAVAVHITRGARTEPAKWLGQLTHRSVRSDAVMLGINTLLHSFYFAVPLHSLSSAVATQTWQGLHATFGPHQPWLSGWMLRLTMTLVMFLAADLAFYVAHRLLHRIPILWALHKVHHSAEVLNPLTVVRRHPGDILFDGLVSGVVLGLAYGLLGFVAGDLIEGYTILGLNGLLFVTLLIGFNLQHSHVWLTFGPLDRLLISPAAHQLHHSDAPAHFDRNFGNMLSVWDQLFGTHLRPPRRPQPLQFGLGSESHRYRSAWRLLLVPLIEVFGNAWDRVGTTESDERSHPPDAAGRGSLDGLYDNRH